MARGELPALILGLASRDLKLAAGDLVQLFKYIVEIDLGLSMLKFQRDVFVLRFHSLLAIAIINRSMRKSHSQTG